MRRVCRPWPLLVLVALAGVVGPPAPALASDAGLRQLVQDQRSAERRYETQLGRTPDFGDPSTVEQLGRRVAREFRRIADTVKRQRRSWDDYRRRFAAEGPETPEADRGRTLVLTGLRDQSRTARTVELAARRAATRYRKVRTAAGLRQVERRFTRETRDAAKTGDRAVSRVKRGRTLIRNAPAPPAPAA